MNRLEMIDEWVEKLTNEEMRPLLVELVDFGIDAEMISFGDLAPYWSNSGDALIDGQIVFADD